MYAKPSICNWEDWETGQSQCQVLELIGGSAKTADQTQPQVSEVSKPTLFYYFLLLNFHLSIFNFHYLLST